MATKQAEEKAARQRQEAVEASRRAAQARATAMKEAAEKAARQRQEAAEASRRAAESRAKALKEAQEKARREDAERQRRDAAERSRKQAEEARTKALKEAAEKAARQRQEAVQAGRRAAESRAKAAKQAEEKAAESRAKAMKEAAEQSRRRAAEAATKARQEAAEQARRQAVERQRRDAADRSRKQAEEARTKAVKEAAEARMRAQRKLVQSSPPAAVLTPRQSQADASARIIKMGAKTLTAAEPSRRGAVVVRTGAVRSTSQVVARAREQAFEAAAAARSRAAGRAQPVGARPLVPVSRLMGHQWFKPFGIAWPNYRANLGAYARLVARYRWPWRRWVFGRYVTYSYEVCLDSGHYEWQTQWVEVEPAHYEMRYVPPAEDVLFDDQGNAYKLPPLGVLLHDSKGNTYKVVLEPVFTEKVWVPARFEARQVQVWVPGRYETRHSRAWIPGYWMGGPYWLSGRGGVSLAAAFKF